MANIKAFIKKHHKELFFQVILIVVLFLFYSFDKHEHKKIDIVTIPFFANYTIVAMLINYVLLPKLFYQKKRIKFALAVIALLGIVIVLEELVLEQIYFPDTRGKCFPGVFFSLAEIVPVMVVFVGFKFAWDINTKQREVEELQSSIKESELQFLKSQINPHFLFNNLNNLYAYAIENSPKTPSLIVELSAVLRYMLYDCKEDFVPLQKELNHIQSFINLNELQIENRGDIQFKVNEIPNNFKIAPLILIMFIENAFKHSTASQSDNIFIYTDINVTKKGELTFNCVNSFLPNTNTDSLAKGIGLQNVEKRLELLYPGAHELLIREEKNVYHITLTLQLTPLS